MNLFGPYSFFHRSFTTGKLPLQKEIYPQTSFINLYQLIFYCLLSGGKDKKVLFLENSFPNFYLPLPEMKGYNYILSMCMRMHR